MAAKWLTALIAVAIAWAFLVSRKSPRDQLPGSRVHLDSSLPPKVEGLPRLPTAGAAPNWAIRLETALSVKAKALPSSQERQVLMESLSNPEFIQFVVEKLKPSLVQPLTRKQEKTHLSQLDLLIRGVDPDFNPTWEVTTIAVEGLLLSDDWKNGPIERRRLLAGDRIELFRALVRAHPGRAEQILAQLDEKTRQLLTR